MLKKVCDWFAGVKMTIVSGIFLLISFIMMMLDHKAMIDPAWVTVIISGYPLLYLAITRLVYQKWISSCLLISIAMVASLLLNEIFAAGEVAFIMSVGAILEDMTVDRAKKGLSKLIELTPTKARLLRDDHVEMIDATNIKKGDILRILPGESIPSDGIIVVGTTSVDQSIMTGESLPVDKTIGDEVFCGTLNCFGSMDIRATNVGENSSLQKLIRMVQEAELKKAPMQRIADQWSVWLVPIALGIAIFGFFINWYLGCPIMDALNRGVTVLVVFCPCALALATPTSIMAAIAQATKHGVIIKSGEALEAMGKVDTITFDKTGTLTYGSLSVSDIVCFEDLKKEELLKIVASIEVKSEHPLGKAIVKNANDQNLALYDIDHFVMEVGRGVSATIDGAIYYCGNKAFLHQYHIPFDNDMNVAINAVQKQGKAIILIGNRDACLGFIALADTLREDSKSIISALNNMQMDTILLTGDTKQSAHYFADQLQMKQVYADLLPSQKVETIQSLRKHGKNVCMIGDGVNDAPALKSSNVGIAMGGIGSDIAIEASDIAFVKDDISKLVYLNKLAKTTIRTITFNISVSMCINAVAVTLSVLGVLNPVTGALVHNAGSFLVVLNAALLYDRKFE